MVKHAMVSVLIGDRHKRIAEVSHPTQIDYAHRHGIDYVIYDGNEYSIYHANGSHSKIKQRSATVTKENTFGLPKPAFGAYNKFNIVEMLEHYERIVYIDTDIIVRDDAPNIFDIVPKDKIGMMSENGLMGGDRERLMAEWCKTHDIDISSWDQEYYNSGVMVISQGHEKLLHLSEVYYGDVFFEQTHINTNIMEHNVPMYHLPYSFNRTSFMDLVLDTPRHSAYFIHYAGSWMMLKEGHSPTPEHLLKIMKHDIEKWRLGSPDHKYSKPDNSRFLGYWVRD